MWYNIDTNTKRVTSKVIQMDTVFNNIRAECARRRWSIEDLADKPGIRTANAPVMRYEHFDHLRK